MELLKEFRKTARSAVLFLALLALAITFASCATTAPTASAPETPQTVKNGNGVDAVTRPQAGVPFVTGHWEGTILIGQWTRIIKLDLHQVGERVEGTVTVYPASFAARPVAVVGTLTGRTLSLAVPLFPSDPPLESEVMDGYMRGTHFAHDLGSGRFFAMRSPP